MQTLNPTVPSAAGDTEYASWMESLNDRRAPAPTCQDGACALEYASWLEVLRRLRSSTPVHPS